jgi:hypothetical protein
MRPFLETGLTDADTAATTAYLAARANAAP